MMNERRQHPRPKISWSATVMTPDGPLAGMTQNLSLGGALIHCSLVPDLEDSFRLVLKPDERQLLVAIAKRVWQDTLMDKRFMFYGMGVSFLYMHEDDLQALSKAIYDHFIS